MARYLRCTVLNVVILALSAAAAESQTTTWAPGAAAPIKRYESPAVTLNGKVYVFGGFTNLTATGVLEATPRVDVYNPAANSWSFLTNIPAPASIPNPCGFAVTGVGLSHHGLALDRDKFVWIAGGFQGNDGGPAVGNVWKYDITANTWSAGPALPAARGGGSLAILGRQLHYVGGTMCDRTTDAGDHWVLDLDAATPTWTTAAPLPNPRTHASLAAVGGKIYAIGGQHHHDVNPFDVNNVNVYNPATDSWSAAASLPAVRSHFEPGTFVRDGRIVIAGGKSDNTPQVNDITEYDPISNTWTGLTPMPAALRAPVAQAVGSKIVVVGGGSTNGYTPTIATSIGSVPATNGSWSAFAPLTPGRAETGVAAAAGKVYVIGGHDADDQLLSTVSVFDPVANSWSNVAVLPGPARDHIGVVSVGEKVYAIGGLTGWPGPSVNTVYMYDPANPGADWVSRAALPTARGAMGVAVINGKIYAAGGLSNSVDVATLTVYDPVLDSWTTLPSMSTNRDHLTAQAVDGKLYAIGGRHTQIGAVVGVTEVYDPAAGPNGTWSTKAPMLTPRGSVGSGVLGGRIFVFGADTGASALNVNEEFDPATDSWRTVTPMITPRSSTSGAVLSGRIFAPGGKGADQQHNLTVNEAFVLGAPPPVSTAFLVQSGQVVMEAENAHGNLSRGGKMWVSQTSPAGLVGSALQALPNTGTVVDTGYTTTTAELQYQVQFPAAGTYHVWLRGYAASTNDNAAHVGMDGQAVATADRLSLPAAGTWTWFKSTSDGPVATVTIATAGVHTINVWMREDGLYLDRLLLTTNAGFTPTGTGPAESPHTGGPSNQAPVVTAGADQSVTLPNGVTLTGSATDDGLPAPPAALTYAWSQLSGPATGTTTFGTPAAASTAASFSVAGMYTLRLTVSDSALSGTDDVVVTVTGGGPGVTCATSANPTVLDFGAAVAGTYGNSGFSCFMPGTVTPTGANLAVSGGSLAVTSTAGDLYQTVNTQNNALGVRLANTGGYAVRTRIKGPFAAAQPYQSAGVYLALNTDNFVKLAVGQGGNGARLEFGLETAAAFSSVAPDTAFDMNALDSATEALDLWLVRKGNGTIEALYRLVTSLTTSPVLGPIVSLGTTAAAPAWSSSSAELYGGLFNTHFNTITPITTAFDEFELGAPVTPGGGSTPFLEQSGQVVMEAENAHGNVVRGGKTWTPQTGPAGLVGGALQALPNTGAVVDSGYATTTAELQYQVQFAAAGTYHVWLRGYAANTNDNAAHVGVDGQAVTTADRLSLPTFGAWTWFKSTTDGPVATVAIASAGVHTINVWMREDGLYLDRLLLTTNAGFTPTGTGPAESPRTGGTGNQAPVVTAGADQIVTLPNGVTLSGSATDDGLPAQLTYAWSQVSGPGTATAMFGSPTAATTTASFPAAGTYTLRLTASDSALSGSDDVVVTANVAGANQPPLVMAGADHAIVLPNGTTLSGSATDDGLPSPPAALTYMWSQVSGPGTTTFGTPTTAATSASFSAAGVYTLRLTANDSALSGTDDVVVTVNDETAVTCNTSPNPTVLSFNGAVAATYGSSGFNCFMPGSVPPTPANISVNGSAGHLLLTSTTGDLYQSLNTQDNALGLRLANTGSYSVSVRIKGPLAATVPYQSAGVYLALNADNYVKLAVGQGGSGPRLEFGIETAAVFASAVPDAPFNLNNLDSSSEALDLWLVRKSNGTIEALYRTITNLTGSPVFGPVVSLGLTSTAPSWSTAAQLYGGLFTTHFGSGGVINVSFDEFSLGAPLAAGAGSSASLMPTSTEPVGSAARPGGSDREDATRNSAAQTSGAQAIASSGQAMAQRAARLTGRSHDAGIARDPSSTQPDATLRRRRVNTGARTFY